MRRGCGGQSFTKNIDRKFLKKSTISETVHNILIPYTD